jgi:DNA-binding NtrC family response regulator
MAKILIVDDEIGIRELLSEILAMRGTTSCSPRTLPLRVLRATR